MIKLICALVLMAVVYAGTYYPETIRATVAYQDGRRAERAKEFRRAIQQYQAALATYPDSKPLLAHLGISYYGNGNTLQAIWVLGELWGRKIPKEVAHQVNDILLDIKRRDGVQ